MIPDDGPNYPWGENPWPGTDPKNIKKDYVYNDEPFQTALSRIKNVRKALGDPPPVRDATTASAPASNGDKTPGEHLYSAGNISATDFVASAAGSRLHGDAVVANNLMSGAFTNFLKAYDAVIAKLEATKSNNTTAEADNVQIVDMVTVDTIEPGQPALPSAALPTLPTLPTDNGGN